jgi:hypothetical protein
LHLSQIRMSDPDDIAAQLLEAMKAFTADSSEFDQSDSSEFDQSDSSEFDQSGSNEDVSPKKDIAQAKELEEDDIYKLIASSSVDPKNYNFVDLREKGLTSLDLVNLKDIPPGSYEVEGKNSAVKIVCIPGVRKEEPGNFYVPPYYLTRIRTCLTGFTNGVPLYLFAPKVPMLTMIDVDKMELWFDHGASIYITLCNGRYMFTGYICWTQQTGRYMIFMEDSWYGNPAFAMLS